MAIITLLAASLMVVPVPDDKLARKIVENYPTQPLRRGESGAVHVRYWLDYEGKIYRCEVLNVLGEEVFGATVCRWASGSKLKPAIAPDGTASYSMITTRTLFVTPGKSKREILSSRSPADLTIQSAEGSPTAQTPNFRILAWVRPDGKVDHCEGFEAAAGESVARACAAALESNQPVGTDQAGSPISYVTSLLVRTEVPQS